MYFKRQLHRSHLNKRLLRAVPGLFAHLLLRGSGGLAEGTIPRPF